MQHGKTRSGLLLRMGPGGYGAVVVNLAVWQFCQNRALPLRGGDFGMPDGACVRLDGSDAATVLRAPPGVVYILRSVPTVT